MKISIISAMANNRVIGKDNDIPWHLPEDLIYFKKITGKSPIIMGRKTYDSINRPLPGRLNIIISRDPYFSIPGCLTATSPEHAIELAGDVPEVFIIGGAKIYEQFLDLATDFYLTYINLDVEGNTYFPDYSRLNLKTTSSESHDNGKLKYKFIHLEKV